MNVLINFSTLKVGGGQNVALNFIHAFPKHQRQGIDFYFFVAKDSAVHKFFQSSKYKHYKAVPRNPLLRILFELFLSNGYLIHNKIDIIYTYFGIGIFNKKIPQISGSADSNLYFPEIDFWNHYTGIARLKKRIIDRYRVWGLKRATAVVFENEIIEERAKQLYKITNTRVIKPSINFSLEKARYHLPDGMIKDAPIGLFLCGWQLNKNILIIPMLAHELKRKNIKLSFIITAPNNNSTIHNQFISLVEKYSVSDMVWVVGQVKKEQLANLYQQIDYVFLLSKLESFSNNIIEAWHFKKPLIVSDELWARSICKDGAVYVDRDSVKDIVSNLDKLINNDSMHTTVVKNGLRMLETYPNIDQRIDEEIDFIRHIYENN